MSQWHDVSNQPKKGHEGKIALLRIDGRLLANFLKFPGNARFLHSLETPPKGEQIAVIVHCEDFPVVPYGYGLPEISPVFESNDDLNEIRMLDWGHPGMESKPDESNAEDAGVLSPEQALEAASRSEERKMSDETPEAPVAEVPAPEAEAPAEPEPADGGDTAGDGEAANE